MSEEIKVYGYRWIVLMLFMLANIMVQILWISFATVTSVAANFYNVDEFSIYLLSMSFMIIYIPVTFLSAWLIDKYDFKLGTSIGVLFIIIFGFLRVFTFKIYPIVLISQLGVAVGQPFLLNSVTKLSANWFPDNERTTATGISLISVFIGVALGLFVTPYIVNLFTFQGMLNIYGISSLIIGIFYIVFIRNRPPTPPSKEQITEKVFVFEGFKKLFTDLNFWILIIAFLVGLGIFNTVLTIIEGIVMPRLPGITDTTYAGNFGLIILIGGIIGCFVISVLSDKYKKRKILLIISIAIAAIALLGITFVTNYTLLCVLGFIFGFGLVSASPVGLEYAAEATKPVSEATSNGILMMVGQIGGILLIVGISDLKLPSGDYFPALLLQSILLIIVLILLIFLKKEKK